MFPISLLPIPRHCHRQWRVLFRTLSNLPDHYKIIMPKVSPTMTAGRLVEWKKSEGDSFLEGEDIADVESDKATMPIAARDDGFMARIFVDPDTPDIPLGRLLAITVEEEEHIAAFKDFVPPEEQDSTSTPSSSTQKPVTQASDTKPQPTAQSTSKIEYNGPIGPAIKRLQNKYPHLDVSRITPTGPQGRLLKGDVLAAIEAGTAFGDEVKEDEKKSTVSTSMEPIGMEQQREVEFTDVAVSSLRRAIAKRLLQSKTEIPHRYASAKYELDQLLALRARLNAGREKEQRISVNDFVIRAVAIALRRVPEVNARWEPKEGAVKLVDDIDVAMAVAIDGGVITPIIPQADRLGLAQIASMSKDLAAKAREGTLEPDEYEGGSFAVTNLGMFGISEFQGVINPPHSGIVAIGAGSKYMAVFFRDLHCKLGVALTLSFSNLLCLCCICFVFYCYIVKKAVMDDDGFLQTVTQGIASLSTDARVVEEKAAGAFLAELTSCLSNPENMLV